MSEKPLLIYIYDALCGWCYGFSPVIKQIATSYSHHIDTTVISGGMVLGERSGPIGQVASYIGEAYLQVEKTTGIQFGEGFLKGLLTEGTANFSSEKPAYAMTAFKQKYPEKAIAFASSLQQALYRDGRDLDQWESYGPLATAYGWDSDKFVEMIQRPETATMTYQEFQLVQEWGIMGFPSVVVKQGEKAFALARGYLPYDSLEANLKQVLSS